MRVFIAEKPELAKAIVEGLGGGSRKGGYIECGADAVTWCFGHMLQLLDPEEYDARYERWSFDTLPFSFIPWKKRPSDDKHEQLGVIVSLLKRARSVVHAGDPDPEGQLLVDEVLEHAGYTGPVQRLLINDNNVAVVKRSLATMRDNRDFAGLSAAAEARAVGDQLYGYNLTRAYTLAARAAGYDGTLSVGRVQTPILGLVVRRCRANAGHTKAFYFVVRGSFRFGDLEFTARYQIGRDDPTDEKGRLNEQAFAEAVAADAAGKPAVVADTQTVKKTAAPPLPYNLLKLQTDASRKFGLKPDAVKDITQALREKHKLITYNRSDCEYLSEEQHPDAPGVLAAIAATAPVLAAACGKANPALKSRAFNSAKVSAHHAIIPTQTAGDLEALTDAERKIYLLIARAYLAQFWSPHLFDQTTVVLDAGGRRFACRANVTTAAGWRVLYRNDDGNEDLQGDDEDLSSDLRPLTKGQGGACTTATADRQETKPPPLYTIATLLSDLTRVAKYVRDDQLRAALIAKDAGKEGEHGGIGTPATRDTILATLFQRGLLAEEGKTVISTAAGNDLYDALPDDARFPDLTAVWHGQQQEIEAGRLTVHSFINDLMGHVGAEVARVREKGMSMNVKVHSCPKCSKPLRRRKSDKGVFWGCTGYPECTVTYQDANGEPALNQKPSPYKCPSCKSPLVRKSSSQKKGFFWSCLGYPDCKCSYPDASGKPVLARKPKPKTKG
ncbi:DNA topoisomerase-3 [Azospirillum brasilense]|nr:DNA topoisomerase-3 [Azospirillum brasilense]